uniref:Ubiquitin-like domain-containing protein n=1 Tax=Acrobeloides nanus TaxID=290746 RepID=A0A914DJT4_9BILA
MIITIRLVGGESDWLRIVNLDPQISFNELEKLIGTMTTIPPQYQYITWRGKLIPASKNPLQSIKEGEELFVKHSFVDKWSNAVLRAGRIEKISGNDQLDEAQTVLDIIDLLKNTKFFFCYSQLGEKMLNIHENMKEYFGGDRTTMEAATRTYFYNMLKAKEILKDSLTFLVSFRNKVRGIHTG